MIPYIDETAQIVFPEHKSALKDPDGLLAAGGDLSIERLLAAYQRGIFPWFGDDDPILWWTPSQRMVIYAQEIHISKSMRRFLNKSPFEMRINSDFSSVISACSEPRADDSGTWITNEMQQAYINLHKHGYASSVECWSDNVLVGGVYGVHLGEVFYGESMFSKATNASKAALIYACQHLNIKMIDCQFYTEHLASLGGQLITRDKFLSELKKFIPSYS